jgi:hypothetical protein
MMLRHLVVVLEMTLIMEWGYKSDTNLNRQRRSSMR